MIKSKRIEIFVAGSTDRNIDSCYYEAAVKFGKLLNSKRHNIIFDGCLGIPGVVAEQFGKYSSNLSIAHTSDKYTSDDWPCASINGTFLCQSEVTRAFLEWSDVLVFFKGDSGTLTELFHAIDTKKNGEHSKPIIILNIDNKWDDLVNLIKTLNVDNLYYIATAPKEVIEYIENTVQLDGNHLYYKKYK